MRVCIGNIWDYQSTSTSIVIPTNIGWANDGHNVMGAGLAKQTANKYKNIAFWYGRICESSKEETPVIKHPEYNLIMFPVKPLNKDKPYLSWKSAADLSLIEKSCKQLIKLHAHPDMFMVYLPLIGCGNGGLSLEDVYPILCKYLNNPDEFALVIESQYKTKLLDYHRNNPSVICSMIKCGIKSCDNTVEWGSREWAKNWCYHWIDQLNKSILLCPVHTRHSLKK